MLVQQRLRTLDVASLAAMGFHPTQAALVYAEKRCNLGAAANALLEEAAAR